MTILTTTVRRGRPIAANDNNPNEHAYAERAEAIREMRANGMTYRDIAHKLDVDVETAWRTINFKSPKRHPLAANDNKVIRRVANNGGCSTTSGMVAVSVARLPTLERPAVQVAA